MLYKITSSSHHNTDRPELNCIIESDPKHIEFDALQHVFDFDTDYIDVNDEYTRADIHAALKKAYKQTKKSPYVSCEITDIFNDVPEEANYQFVLWRIKEDGRLNFGFGQTDDGTINGTNKAENRWVHFEEWKRDEKRYQDLLTKSKEWLANEICILESAR